MISLSSGTFPNFKTFSPKISFASSSPPTVTFRLSVRPSALMTNIRTGRRLRLRRPTCTQTRKQHKLVSNPNESITKVKSGQCRTETQTADDLLCAQSLRCKRSSSICVKCIENTTVTVKKGNILFSRASISRQIYNRRHLHNKCGEFSSNLRVIYIAFHELCNVTPPRRDRNYASRLQTAAGDLQGGRSRSGVNGGLRPLLIKGSVSFLRRVSDGGTIRGTGRAWPSLDAAMAERRRYRRAAERSETFVASG